jgi:hypothetical protein
MITGPLDRNIPVEAMDKATFPEAIAATRAGNEHIAFKCATNLYLNINTPSATAQTIQKNDRLTNWAEQFAFGNLLSEDEGKKMTAALGLEDLDSLQKISDAIRTMPEEKFPAFKAVLVSHLGRVTGEAATIEGTDTAKAKELLERKLVEFSDRKHAAEEKRDVIREAYMSDRIVAVFQGQMDAGKKPLLMVVCGAGHTEHHAEGKEGRDDLDELVMQKDKRIKAAVITFVPLKKEELEKLPLKDGTAVFYAGGGYQGAQYVCFIEGARYNAICRLSEAPGKAPNHAELEKVRQFQERQPKETQR